MLTKEQVIRLIMILDSMLENDVAEHDVAIQNRFDSIVQTEMFDKEDRYDYLIEKVKNARNTLKFDEELRELLVEGLRSVKFREEAERILEDMKGKIEGLKQFPNNMGKVLLFKRA